MDVGVPYSQTNPNELVEFDGFWKLGYLIFEDLELELLNEFHWSRLEQWSVPPPFYPFTLFTLLHALWHILYYIYILYIIYILYYYNIILLWHICVMYHYYDIMCIFSWNGNGFVWIIGLQPRISSFGSVSSPAADRWDWTEPSPGAAAGWRMVTSNSWL